MKVSIIVPVLNEAERLPTLFTNLEQIRSASQQVKNLSIELVFVDGGSVDATPTLFTPADIFLHSEKGRARQMNFAAQRAQGDLLVFLHADTLLPTTIVDEWRTLINTNRGWGYAPVRLDHSSFWFRLIEWCMNARSRFTRIATGDQLLCVSRKLFNDCGGFAQIELMEDVEISSRLRKHQKPTIFNSVVVCSARKWLQHGIAKTVLLMWAIRAAYFFGVSPAKLHNYYYGKA